MPVPIASSQHIFREKKGDLQLHEDQDVRHMDDHKSVLKSEKPPAVSISNDEDSFSVVWVDTDEEMGRVWVRSTRADMMWLEVDGVVPLGEGVARRGEDVYDMEDRRTELGIEDVDPARRRGRRFPWSMHGGSSFDGSHLHRVHPPSHTIFDLLTMIHPLRKRTTQPQWDKRRHRIR
ncbi:hypothetical protein ONZ45_g11140 [Pleurotus djamor]|nr:hypothetical protein ONZ45_g11140 [Pleurotus djamor]